MCGLFGLVSNSVIGDFEKEQFRKASYLSSVRGIDSTGYLRIAGVIGKRPAYANFIKCAKDPISFAKLPEVRKFVAPPNLFSLLGHTRSATKGSVNTTNAHPFQSKCGRFIMFHNGTLNNAHPEYETDSEWLVNKIGEAQGDLEQVLPDVLGAYCLVIWDAQERNISIIRNSQRPLFYAQRGKWKFYYASEDWMLGTTYANLTASDIKSLPVHKKLTIQFDDRMDFEVTEVDVKATKPFQGYSYGGYQGRKAWDDYDFFEGGFYGEKLKEELGEELQGNLALPPTKPSEQKPEVHGATERVAKQAKTSSFGNLDPSQFVQKTNEENGKSAQGKGGSTTDNVVVPFRNRNIIRTRLTQSNDVVSELYLIQIGFKPEDIKVILEASEEIDIDTEGINELIENGIMNFGTEYTPTTTELNLFVTFFLSKGRAVHLFHYKNLVATGCAQCGRTFDYDEQRNWPDIPGVQYTCFGNCTPLKNINLN
jgi:glucosamine 6-phosphate synthetase-like amidotransferase/phosphosugar isomerase protein